MFFVDGGAEMSAASTIVPSRSSCSTVGSLLRQTEQHQDHVPISESTAKRYLKQMPFTYKRYRYSLKKGEIKRRSNAGKVIDTLAQLDQEQGCELLYFDESG